jgi:hypothetical protein
LKFDRQGRGFRMRWITPAVARFAAVIAGVAFLTSAVLQALLALGIIPVTMAWGGRQPELTSGLRTASVIAALALVAFAVVIWRRAGLLGAGPSSRVLSVLAWTIAAFLLVNTVGNAASKSMAEAAVFGPLSLIEGIASAVVAAAPYRGVHPASPSAPERLLSHD